MPDGVPGVQPPLLLVARGAGHRGAPPRLAGCADRIQGPDVRRRVLFPDGCVPEPVAPLYGEAPDGNEPALAGRHVRKEEDVGCRLRPRQVLPRMANDQRTECLATALHTGLREDMSLPDLWRHTDACTHALRGDVAALDDKAAMSLWAVRDASTPPPCVTPNQRRSPGRAHPEAPPVCRRRRPRARVRAPPGGAAARRQGVLQRQRVPHARPHLPLLRQGPGPPPNLRGAQDGDVAFLGEVLDLVASSSTGKFYGTCGNEERRRGGRCARSTRV